MPATTRRTRAGDGPARLLLAWKRSLSPNTIRAYEHDVAEFFGLRDLRQLTRDSIRRIGPHDIQRYRRRLGARYRPATIARKLSALHSTFERFAQLGWRAENPMTRSLARRPKIVQRPMTGLTGMEVRRLLRQPNRATLLGRRDTAILLLILDSGLRRSELIGLRCEHLIADQGGPALQVPTTSGHMRTVRLTAQAAAALEGYLKTRGIDPTASESAKRPVFVRHAYGRVLWQRDARQTTLSGEALRQMIRKYMTLAGVRASRHIQTLRRTRPVRTHRHG